jgi:hypothetical protein
MSNDDIFQDYPRRLASTEPSSPVYTRLSGFYAVHNWRADISGVEPVQTFADDRIAIIKGEPGPASATTGSSDVATDPPDAATDATADTAAQPTLSPIYAQQSGGSAGSMAVPTGRVFIRFADAVKVADRETQIHDAGYEIDQKLDYAPNAAWLRARSGNIADALNGIATLAKLADVENVEPQLLMQASYR